MDIGQIVNTSDERLAAQALDGLRDTFVGRIGQIPLVNRSLEQLTKTYERTKNTSSIVKYSAESVESGVSVLSPLLSTVAPALRPLDRLASNTLDRIQTMVPDAAQLLHAPVRGLRYSADFLKHAIAHIHHSLRVLSLQLAQVQPQLSLSAMSQTVVTTTRSLSASVVHVAAQVRRVVVETLRRVVQVLGTHASPYLPVAAKQAVKSFILGLPTRLVQLINQGCAYWPHPSRSRRPC